MNLNNLKERRKNFFERVASDYFNQTGCSLEAFESMLKTVFPVFGTLVHEINAMEDGYQLTFIDHHLCTNLLDANGEKNYLEENERFDQSTQLCVLHLNQEKVIQTVEHSIQLITPANKEMLLFYGNLVGKSLTF